MGQGTTTRRLNAVNITTVMNKWCTVSSMMNYWLVLTHPLTLGSFLFNLWLFNTKTLCSQQPTLLSICQPWNKLILHSTNKYLCLAHIKSSQEAIYFFIVMSSHHKSYLPQAWKYSISPDPPQECEVTCKSMVFHPCQKSTLPLNIYL